MRKYFLRDPYAHTAMVQPERDPMQVVPPVKKRYVILLHGLWMNGLEMGVLAHRLRRCGYTPITYPYKDWRFSPAQNAAHLQSWMESLQTDEVNFVAHSLGGVVLLHLFDRYPRQRPGRVVLLASPVRGSIVAEGMARRDWSRRTLGRSVEQGLLGGAPVWRGHTDLGVIGGTLGLGLGGLFARLQPPHDGSVELQETLLPGAKAHIALRINHMGILLSAEAARQTCAFLIMGRFR